MPNERDLKLDEYAISKYAYRELKYFCLQYPEKKRRIADLHNPLRAMNYDGMPHGTSPGEPTARAAELAASLSGDIEIIEQTAIEADCDIYQYIILAVSEDVPYHFLRTLKSIPCGRDYFNQRRRKFFYLLAKKKGIA